MTPQSNAFTSPEKPIEIVLFHSARGLRAGVTQWAERLREGGYTVHTPDLYDGEVFDDIPSGMAKVERMGGYGALMERTQQSVANFPANLVYAGFSNGAGSAELLAATRPRARGAILMHGAMPVEAFGASEWPATVPVQLHYAERDPYRDQEGIDAFAATVRRSGATYGMFDYPIAGHLFADPEVEEFDAAASEEMFGRILEFLRGLK